MTQLIENQSVCNSRTANTIKCSTCSNMSGSVEAGVDYCTHPAFNHIVPEIEDPEIQPDFCPLIYNK